MILKSICLRAAAERLRAPLVLDAFTLKALSQLLALQAAQIAQDGGCGGGTATSVKTRTIFITAAAAILRQLLQVLVSCNDSGVCRMCALCVIVAM
jgi:hypothetical protein